MTMTTMNNTTTTTTTQALRLASAPRLAPARPTLRELLLAAECCRLKAGLMHQAIHITGLEEHNRALTAALHKANSR
jgi:hypothetical protein